MIQMRDMQGEVPCRSQEAERVEEGDRIGTSGDGDHDPLVRGQQLLGDNRLTDPYEEGIIVHVHARR